MCGEVDGGSPRQQHRRQPREASADVPAALQRDLGRFEVRTLGHPNDRPRPGDRKGVVDGPMEVGLQTDADQRISVSKPEVQVDRALDVVARLHIDHDEHRPVSTGRRLQDPLHVLSAELFGGVEAQLGQLDRDVAVQSGGVADPLQGLDVPLGCLRGLRWSGRVLPEVFEHRPDALGVEPGRRLEGINGAPVVGRRQE